MAASGAEPQSMSSPSCAGSRLKPSRTTIHFEVPPHARLADTHRWRLENDGDQNGHAAETSQAPKRSRGLARRAAIYLVVYRVGVGVPLASSALMSSPVLDGSSLANGGI